MQQRSLEPVSDGVSRANLPANTLQDILNREAHIFQRRLSAIKKQAEKEVSPLDIIEKEGRVVRTNRYGLPKEKTPERELQLLKQEQDFKNYINTIDGAKYAATERAIGERNTHELKQAHKIDL